MQGTESMPSNVGAANAVGRANNNFGGLSDASISPSQLPMPLWSRVGPQVLAAMAGSVATALVGALVLATRRHRGGRVGAALVDGEDE